MDHRLAWRIAGYVGYGIAMCLPVYHSGGHAAEPLHGWRLFLTSFSTAYEALFVSDYSGLEAVLYIGSAYANALTVLSVGLRLLPFARVAGLVIGRR